MNNETPFISAVVTFLNEERFLAEAVESVIAQSYENWELILVDDGSSDDSTRIAQDYARRFPGKIIYAEHEGHINRGLSASRNLGADKARGELIAFLDADDVWTEEKLKKQAAMMTANPRAAMLCEACEYWHNWDDDTKQNVIVRLGEVWSDKCDYSTLNEIDRVFQPPELAERLYPLAHGSAPSLSGMVVRKAILKKYGGFEEQFRGMYQLYEDQAFLLKIYLNEPVYISSLFHHKYRQRQGSIVHKNISEGNYYIVRQFFLKWLLKYLKQNNIQHRQVLKLLKKELNKYYRPAFYLKNLMRPTYRKLKKRFE